MHTTTNAATLSGFEKKSSFIEESPSFFQKNPNFERFRNLTNSIVAFYGKFATIRFKKSHVQERE